MVNCPPRKLDRTVSHFMGAQIKSVISVLTRLHEPLLVPDRDIVVVTESAHTESCLYRRSINVCQRNHAEDRSIASLAGGARQSCFFVGRELGHYCVNVDTKNRFVMFSLKLRK